MLGSSASFTTDSLLGKWQAPTSSVGFSPLTANRRSFADAPMKVTSIGHRLNTPLESAGLSAGESNHGFRRGQIQDLLAAGVSKPQIGEVVQLYLQIKTASVLEKYADVSRHMPRLQHPDKRKGDQTQAMQDLRACKHCNEILPATSGVGGRAQLSLRLARQRN